MSDELDKEVPRGDRVENVALLVPQGLEHDGDLSLAGLIGGHAAKLLELLPRPLGRISCRKLPGAAAAKDHVAATQGFDPIQRAFDILFQAGEVSVRTDDGKLPGDKGIGGVDQHTALFHRLCQSQKLSTLKRLEP